MRIAYITAGAAGMYCGSCLHDNTLAAALLALGEDVLLVPTYTPLRTDEQDVSIGRVFFGGINVYLQEKVPLFRHTPWWFDRLLDNPALLERLSKRASSVDPTQLGGMTVSMLRGEAGNQRKEVEKLVHWLLAEVKPDVVHLSNSMQIGMARMIRDRGGPPVVCQLSGEDLFLEKLRPPFYEEARAHLRERAGDVDAFVALNRYYANFMADYLGVDHGKVHVIPHGLNLDGHAAAKPPAELGAAERIGAEKGYLIRRDSQPPALPGVRPPNKRSDQPQVIGYFARICEDKGLHLLVEACELLAKQSDLPPFELRAAGYLGDGDRSYLKRLEDRAASGPLAGHFRYLGELDRAQKIAFLQSLDIFSTPTAYRESKGIPALEAMANGVPVVLPDHGSFSEMVDDTAGGVLHRPHDPADLASKLEQLLRDPLQAAQLGLAGQRAVQDRYHAAAMARQTRELYQTLLARNRGNANVS
ncbi:MAG TPA: glycosyltransferase family 4 protein [Lacipirellulaceae bacterium]|jgi:glycosyltransferase involved in cell wall biosynthesis|nr:glycosyltransferase family 4 protein [Lacipirellulaceae bacterium]